MTEPGYTLRDAALAVDCETCMAEPGDACMAKDGSATEPVHDERIEQLRTYVRSGVSQYDQIGGRP